MSGIKTAALEPTKKAAVKLSDHIPITYLLSTLCKCRVCQVSRAGSE